MSSVFPNNLDNLPTSHQDKTGQVSETIHASTINDLASAINTIQPSLLNGLPAGVGFVLRDKGGQVYNSDAYSNLQAAADAAAGAVLYLQAGVHTVSLSSHPLDPSYKVGLVLHSGTRLTGPGSIKLADNQPSDGYVILNYNIVAGGDEGIVIDIPLIDGNNANQTHIHHGIGLIRARGCTVTTTAKNLRGTGTSGPTENFFFTAQLSGDISYKGAVALCTGGSSSSGFGADQCTNISYEDARAIGMTVGNGFTHSGSRLISHVNCHGFKNGNHSFNSETSTDVSYTACDGGGTAATGSSPYPYSSGQSLGNTGNGFTINGSNRVSLDSCKASKNATGLWIGGNSTKLRVNGGAYCENGYGISVTDATSGGNLRCRGAIVADNTITDVYTAQVGNMPAQGFLPAPPAVPSSTVSCVNQTGFDCQVLVFGGTVSNIAINGAGNINLTSGWFRIPAGGNIAITYSSAPSWYWYAD